MPNAPIPKIASEVGSGTRLAELAELAGLAGLAEAASTPHRVSVPFQVPFPPEA